MPALKPEQLTAQVKSGKIGKLYVFDGPENWLKERAVKQILDKYIPKDSRDLNFDRFNGNDSSPGNIISAAQSMPFLGEKRLILVQATEELSAAETRLVGESISDLPDSTIAIFLYNGKAKMREEIPARATSEGALVTFWTPFPNQLPSWIVTEVKTRGKTISYDAARALGEACANLQEISNELDKLILFVGKKGQIDYDDLMTHGLPEGFGDYADLEDAIWKRDLGGVLKQGQSLAEMGIRAESIFPVFERVFTKLLLARFSLDEKKERLMDIYASLGLRGKTRQFQLEKGLKSYSPNEIRDSLEKIINANMDLKTGRLQSDFAVSLLAVNLVGRKSASNLAFR